MNQVTLIGNLGKDPEEKNVGEYKVARFTLATRRGKDETDWHNITLWGKQAEVAMKYCKKGSKVCIIGSINYSKVNDKIYTEINASQIELLDKASDSQSEQKTEVKPKEQKLPLASGDDLPF